MAGKIFKRTAKAASKEAAVQATGVGAQLVEDTTGVPVATLLSTGMTIKELMDAANEKRPVTNPLMSAHYGFSKHGEASSATQSYLRKRSIKKIAGIGYDVVGKSVQMGLDVAGFGMGGVDAFGLGKHGVSEASTIAHLVRLGILSRKVKQSTYLTGLVTDLCKVKATKAVHRGGKVAAAAIPNTIASTAVSITVSVGGAAAKAIMQDLVCRLACEIHWRAHQELLFAGRYAVGGYGPACRMAQELFNHTLSSDFVPTNTVKSYMKEPAGWLVIHDKLSML